jgi:manganese/zinc/iron transport system substrate-binding protein
VWFDVALWSQVAECVAETLTALDPDHEDGYEARAADAVQELQALDEWVREEVEALAPEQRVLVTAHDAFGYFGRAYGFEVYGLLGVSTASEAGTADVQELAEFIAERQIPAIFVETSVPPRYVQALQEAVRARGFAVEIGGSLYSDSLGSPGTPEETYDGTVRANVETIVTALTVQSESE